MRRKTTVRIFQATNWPDCSLDIVMRGKSLEKKTEHLLIATQKNAIRTNYTKVNIIYNLQHNSQCRPYEERDETVNHVTNNAANCNKRSTRLGTTG